jgi:HSP20 family molecular chaperone IbpA
VTFAPPPSAITVRQKEAFMSTSLTTQDPRASTGWHPVRWIKDHLSTHRHDAAAEVTAAGTDAPRWVRVYVPTFTVRHGKNALVIKARLEGVKSSDLDIETGPGYLTIRGKRTDDGSWDLRTFDHTYVLPSDIDRESIRASYKRGQLTVVMSIPAVWRPRSIPILAQAPPPIAV